MLTRIAYPEMADSYYISARGRTHRIEKEPDASEIVKVERALAGFEAGGFIGDERYDSESFARLRAAVRANYEVTWTSITPPMERLLYAIAAIRKPQNVVCIGVFCGNTLTWNVGAASGPGRCYTASRLTGVEIDKAPAALASRNLASIGMGDVDVRCEDGFVTLDAIDYPIDLLYLDAFGHDPETDTPNTKRIYLSLLHKALPKLAPRAVVVAHDTCVPEFTETRAREYLEFVRSSGSFRASYSVEIDEEGLEVSFL